MTTLTEKAQSKVKETLSLPENSSYLGIRVQVEGAGCSGFMHKLDFVKSIDDITTSDEVIEFDAFKVVIDRASLMYLDETEIDYINDLRSSGFKFNSPNITSKCGCGESFNYN